GFKGHTYRYSFDDKKLIDFGQCSENWSFRLMFDKNWDVLGTARSGYIYKIHTDTLEVEDLNFRIPFETYPEYTGGDYKCLSNGGIGPDGRLYMCFFYSRKVVAYDSDTNTFEDMGDYMPQARCHANGETRNGIFAMNFDNDGVLWYAVFSRNCSSGKREIGLPSSLFRWDVARGKKPEWMGIIGTKERAACWTSEICVSKDDIMFVIGSNHATDGPDITAVNLREYKEKMYNFGELLTEDEYYVNPNSKRYNKIADFLFEQDKFGEENDWRFQYELAYEPLRLWRELAPDNIENSSVKSLHWSDANTLVGVCGNEREFVFKAVEGKMSMLCDKDRARAFYDELMNPKPIIALTDLKLPYYPGRQYKATVTAQAKMADGSMVIGTLDGMLALCKNDKVFGLGPAAYNGPIRALCSVPDGKKVYGVGGDEDDLGMVFSFDAEDGLRWLGHVCYDAPSAWSTVSCPILTACSVSPDGRMLALGSGDRLGTVVICRLP
ncbi:MAG: hypothetical protein RR368_04915, partial [Oscillospiraceae bacterium]